MTIEEKIRGFVLIASRDQRLLQSHFCLYVALCIKFSGEHVDDKFRVSRKEIMQLAKINSIATYHKCMRELVAFGYIDYTPSFHPVNGSVVRLNDFAMLIK